MIDQMIDQIIFALQNLPSFFQYQDPIFSVYVWQYLAMLIIFFGSRLIILILLRILLHSLSNREAYVFFINRIQVVHSYTLALLIFIRFIPYLYLAPNNALISNIIQKLNFTCLVLLVFLAYRIVDISFLYFRQSLPEDSRRNLYFLPFVRKMVKISITILSLILLPRWFVSYDISPILNHLSLNIALITTGIAFALKDTIHNFIGGGTIIMDNMFVAGDRIHINGTEGVVRRLDLRTTEIETDTGSLINIPNAVFTNKELVNYGHVTKESFTMQILIDDLSSSSLDSFLKGFYDIVKAHPQAVEKKCMVSLDAIEGNTFSLSFDLAFKPITERQNILYSCEIVSQLKKLASGMYIKLQG